jgi:hypothetical protein
VHADVQSVGEESMDLETPLTGTISLMDHILPNNPAGRSSNLSASQTPPVRTSHMSPRISQLRTGRALTCSPPSPNSLLSSTSASPTLFRLSSTPYVDTLVGTKLLAVKQGYSGHIESELRSVRHNLERHNAEIAQLRRFVGRLRHEVTG